LGEFKIPKSHPRYHSLLIREKLVKGFKKGMVVPEGLIAHGRGETFDYLLGEKTHEFAIVSIKVTIASLLLARSPIISVNGNLAALAGEQIVELSNLLGIPIEVNIFYRTEERIRIIEKYLKDIGARNILGSNCKKTFIPGLESPRGIVCFNGIYSADFVLLGIEDGDRTEALRRIGKKIAAIDLNPFSRTAQMANITIVDEATRALSKAIEIAKELKNLERDKLEDIVKNYDNRRILSEAFETILQRLEDAKRKGLIISFSTSTATK